MTFSKGQTLTRTSQMMNLLILFALIATSAAFAERDYKFQSSKLNRWDDDIQNPPAASDSQSGRSNQFYEGIFRTRVDHFRPQNQERVNFRYHVNANYFQETGPLYIYLKDYRDYSTRWIESGLMVDIARETGAALLTLDHRYFGQNLLRNSTSFEDLEFLSVQQSLADIAEFIRFVRENANSRVILWGSGYGASLAVYARSRYPHLVYAAWSSSGYLESQIASFGVFDTFETTFQLNDGGQCREAIRNAYLDISALVLSGEGEYLRDRMNLCHPVETTSEADVASLYELTMRAVMTYIEAYHYVGLTAFCNDMTAIPGEGLNSFARWVRYVYGDSECFDHSYTTVIERTSNTTWGSYGTNDGRRQWYYLQCTQIGSFLLADSYTWLVGHVSLDYHIQKCQDVLGFEVDFDNLYSAFDALRFEFNDALTNVIYTNGFLDPFRYFGRLYDPNYLGFVFNMDYASKSADLPSQSLSDPVSVYNAKSQIIYLISTWSTSNEREER